MLDIKEKNEYILYVVFASVQNFIAVSYLP